MPRRKYGHLIGACPPTPQEKCRACRLGLHCNVHDEKSKPDFKALAKRKRKRHSGGKKARRQTKKITKKKKE